MRLGRPWAARRLMYSPGSGMRCHGRAFPCLLTVVVVATLLSSASASAATQGTAETRVGASSVVVEPLVGPPERIAAGQRLGTTVHRVIQAVATGVAANGATRLQVQIGTKIEKQMGKRGWTRDSVEDLINNPARTVRTRDTRHLPGGGRNDAPATAYINRGGGYVVRNDETGDIVQVSNLNDPNWKSPW